MDGGAELGACIVPRHGVDNLAWPQVDHFQGLVLLVKASLGLQLALVVVVLAIIATDLGEYGRADERTA